MGPRFRSGRARALALGASLYALAACSGGGGSPGTSAGSQVEPAAAVTASPSAGNLQSVVTGTVVDLPYDGTSAHLGYSVVPPNATSPAPGAPIANAVVYIGPDIVAGSTPPPALPAGFATTVTAADGSFRLTNGPTGHMAISIFAPAPHVAALHADVALAGGPNAAGIYFMTVPTAGERAWLATETSDRAAYGVPAAGFDEAALEAARYWAAFMQRNAYFAHCIPASACTPGDTTAAPATYGPQDVDPSHRFHYEHGFSGALEAENIAAGFPSWQAVETAFMAEESACPNGAVATCPFSEATGHFLNIVDAEYAWSAVAIVAPAGSAAYFDQEFTAIQSTSALTNDAARRRLATGLRFTP